MPQVLPLLTPRHLHFWAGPVHGPKHQRIPAVLVDSLALPFTCPKAMVLGPA
jgi:hypothetical protein